MFSPGRVKNYVLKYITDEQEGKAIGRTLATITIYHYLTNRGMYTTPYSGLDLGKQLSPDLSISSK